jgi:hypothetical protein
MKNPRPSPHFILVNMRNVKMDEKQNQLLNEQHLFK